MEWTNSVTNLVAVVAYHESASEVAMHLRVIFNFGMPVGWTLYILGRIGWWLTRTIIGVR